MSNEQIEPDPCPGHFQWSAFGAPYPDTVCADALDWSDVEDGFPGPVLCDADDDLRPKDIPCPMHDWVGFWEYQFGGGYTIPLCAVDEARLPDGTRINFHDGYALSWTAICPDHGNQKVLMRDYSERGAHVDLDSIPEWKPFLVVADV